MRLFIVTKPFRLSFTQSALYRLTHEKLEQTHFVD